MTAAAEKTTPRTRQEIFDLAWNGLKAQGFQKSEAGRCRYRGPNGLKCAIGHCIPDDMYDPDMEGGSPYRGNIRIAAQIASGDGGFAASLQSQHDNAESPHDMETNLRWFASEYSLAIPSPAA